MAAKKQSIEQNFIVWLAVREGGDQSFITKKILTPDIVSHQKEWFGLRIVKCRPLRTIVSKHIHPRKPTRIERIVD
jgi:hypothetical protein